MCKTLVTTNTIFVKTVRKACFMVSCVNFVFLLTVSFLLLARSQKFDLILKKFCNNLLYLETR